LVPSASRTPASHAVAFGPWLFIAEGQAVHTRSVVLLGSTATFSFLPQSVNARQKLALFVELKLPASHGAHFLSLALVGGTLT
jgi:hypothetical protein